MKPGGLARLQFNGLPRPAGASSEVSVDTWSGARFSSAELMEFTALHDFQVLALEGVGTQYMWTTWRKRERGWFEARRQTGLEETVRIRRITNAHSSEPLAAGASRPFRSGSKTCLQKPACTTCASPSAIPSERSPTSVPPIAPDCNKSP
jgi:hypothetical protein